MKFTKMHGCGNDYVYINCFEEKVENAEELAVAMSDRHFGVGSDGIVLIAPSECADVRMIMYNADGSRAEMCGNASRCVAKYVFDRGIVRKSPIALQTDAGIKIIDVKTNEKGEGTAFTVNMGKPVLKGVDIPVAVDSDQVKGLVLESEGRRFDFTCVSMGNPHAVTFVDEELSSFAVEKYGAPLETDKVFPKKCNIEFARKIDETHLEMRVWERGTGETLACGTGTCATVVAANLNGICERVPVEVKLLGGKLTIYWDPKDDNVYMTGLAEFVFDGIWERG